MPDEGSDQPQPSDLCPAGEDQRQTPTAGLSRGRRPLRQLRRIGPRWLRRTNVKLRIASIPSWAKPVQQGSRTQVSMVGNLGESQTVGSLSQVSDAEKTPRMPPPRKLLQSSLPHPQCGASRRRPRPLQCQKAHDPSHDLAPGQRLLCIEEGLPAPADLAAAVEAVQGLLLRWQRHPVFFEERQFYLQQTFSLDEPLKTPSLVGVRLLQRPPPDDQGPGVSEDLLVVIGGLVNAKLDLTLFR